MVFHLVQQDVREHGGGGGRVRREGHRLLRRAGQGSGAVRGRQCQDQEEREEPGTR